MADWVHNWQSHFQERGSSGLNLVLGNQYNSLLRSEGGLRFDQIIDCKRGRVTLEESLSYVNQIPFHVHNATTSFVSSVSTFPIAIGSTKMEQLGAAELRVAYSSESGRGKVLLDLQAEINESYQSYFAGLDFNFSF